MANTNPNQIITWQASEFKNYTKNTGWYLALVIGTILVMLFFLIVQRDIFASVSLGLMGVLVIFFSRHLPETINIELNSTGVRFGRLFYPYKQIKYFWVVQDEHHKTVNFHTSALINNELILELEKQDPETVRLFLLRFLPEHHETQATAAQKIMHWLKF